MGISYESRYVETRFGPTHTVIGGNSNQKPVVLWHGLNTNSATWIRWIPVLAQTYQVFAIDTLGSMGQSSATRPSNKGSENGEWAAETLSGLGLTRANMIGQSNGGWLIIKLANANPEAIGSCVLMSSAGFLSLSLTMVFRTMRQLVFKPKREAAQLLFALLSPPDTPADPFFVGLLELTMKSGFRAELNPPALKYREIRKLASPTCLLMGEYERSFDPHKAIKRALRLLPNVISAEIVPGVGHAMLHRQADWVSGRVLRFLDMYAV